MKNGPARFTFYLDLLEKLITEAATQTDPAFWLYQNGARTPLFMLEGLAKLYSGLHNKKRFEKIGEHFKLLEDALGAPAPCAISDLATIALQEPSPEVLSCPLPIRIASTAHHNVAGADIPYSPRILPIRLIVVPLNFR